MGPVQAIKTGLFRSFQFQGRTPRSAFWWFAPLATVLPVAAATVLTPPVTDLGSLLLKLLCFCFASIPLVASAYRRFQDTGLPGREIWDALRPTLVVVFCGYLTFIAFTGLASIVFAVPGLMIGLIAVPVLLFNLMLAPGLLGIAIGQLLLPSEQETNRFGPNPHEVAA